MKTRVFSLLLIPVIILLFYFLVYGVKGPLDEKRKITRVENQVIRHLKLVRELQAAYLSQNGVYADTWDKLEKFTRSGYLINIQKIETSELQDDGKEKIIIRYDTLGRIGVMDSISRKFPLLSKLDVQNLSQIPPSFKNQFTLFASKIDNGNGEINVFEVRDEYPINPERGAEFNENTEPYSITRMVTFFENKLKARTDDAVKIQRKMRDAADAEKESLQKELDDISKYINLYEKRIERLQTKPLRVGSRVEASTAGNWE